MAIDAKIAARLREARISCGYESSAEAADAMDLTYGTYAGHENGNRGVPLHALSRYAKFFRVNLEWLAEGRPPMKGRSVDMPDILADLPPEGRTEAYQFIEYLKAKYGV